MAAKKRNTAYRFHIGQRVTGKYEPFTNHRGTILGPRTFYTWTSGKKGYGYLVQRDDKGRVSKNGRPFAAREETIVPLYDGDQPSAWSQCAWKPREVCNG